MNPGKTQPAPSQEPGRNQQEKNESLKDPGAAVADYGSSGKGTERLDRQNGENRENERGLNEDDTLGIP
jgi:hypothetical protein